MYYRAIFSREGEHFLAEFPDCAGCATFASSEEELRERAKEAVELWLETELDDGEEIPKPAFADGVAIEIDLALAFSIQLRWKRKELGLSQADLAKRLGVSQQSFAKLERPDANPRLSTISKLAAVGVRLSIMEGQP